MSTQFSVRVRNARGQAIETTIGTSAKLKIFGGAAKPANCAAADAGTQLIEAPLPSDWMADPSGGSVAKAGTWEDASADATGLARYYRITDSGETQCDMQGLVSMAWAATTAQLVGQHVSFDGRVYLVTAGSGNSGSSGPTGTGTGITDGGYTLDYVGLTGLVLQNVSIALGQAVTVSSFSIAEGNA